MSNQEMPVNTWEMWGLNLYGGDIDGVLKIVSEKVDTVEKIADKPLWIATVNTEFMVKSADDPVFKELLQRVDLRVMDGIGLVWAREIQLRNTSYELRIIKAIKIGVEVLMGKYQGATVTGVELTDRFCKLAADKRKSVYFYGGWGDRAARTADYFVNKYPGLVVAGAKDEGFDTEKESGDFLLVARGMKKQEEWIDENRSKLNFKVVMGVGRTFDYYSGDLKRAPDNWRKIGLEWLYSLIREPSRWRRQLALPRFIWKIVGNDVNGYFDKNGVKVDTKDNED